MSNTGAISPAEVLFYQNSSLLDTVFVNKSKKKPVWITVTSGSQTTLYSVSPSGELTSAAMIEWDSKGNGSKKSEVTVKFGEETFSGHKFGQPSGGFYGPSSARHFTIDDLNCRWSCRTLTHTSGPGSFTWQFDDVVQWNCTAEIPGSLPSPPLHMSPTSKILTLFKASPPGKQRMMLASYFDGSSKIRSQGLSIYPEGVPYTAQLIVSAILSDSEAGFWRKQQSKSSIAEIEATLSADLGGELPAYTPVRHTSSARTVLHPSVAIRPPSRWAGQGPRMSLLTPPDDFPPEYASTHRPSTQ